MKAYTTHIFDPVSEFGRDNTHFHLTAEQAFMNLFGLLDAFCGGPEEAERGDFLGVPAGQANEYFVWKHTKGVEAREVALPPGMAHALNNLYYAFCRRLQQEYEKGLSDGTDLLRRLAAGEIAIHDVDAVRIGS